MSTSKRRRKAREWMQREVRTREEAVVRAERKGYGEGVRAMERDMTLLMAEPDRKRSTHSHVISYARFPDPREQPYVTFPMPTPVIFKTPVPTSTFDRRMQFVKFRAIQHEFTVADYGEKASLRWFTWEPEEGTPELKERTEVLFRSMGELFYAATLLESDIRSGGASSEVMKAQALVWGCFNELRRRMGKFAPVPDDSGLNSRQKDYAYLYGRQPW